MGDTRFTASYVRVRDAPDRARLLAKLTDEETVEALAAASRANDPFLANILATEATNRMRRLRATLAHLGEGVVTIGPEGIVRWANPSAEKLLGCARKDMIGKHFHDLAECPDASALLRAIREVEELRDDDEVIRLKDGRGVTVTCTVTKIVSDVGEFAGMVITLTDISERKARERTMRINEQRYRCLFEHYLDAVVTMDADGTILEVNEAAEKLTGYRPRDVLGRTFGRFIDPADRDRALEMFSEVARGKLHRTTLQIRRADGQTLAADTIGIPIVVDHEVVGIHGVARPASR